MEHLIKKTVFGALFIALLWTMQSCYNDNYETLYPNQGTCDTTAVTFSNDVWPVISSKCTACHSGSAPAGNIPLENHGDVVAAVNNGRFVGSIRQENGYSPMPKGGNKLDDCTLLKIDAWINKGMPNN